MALSACRSSSYSQGRPLFSLMTSVRRSWSKVTQRFEEPAHIRLIGTSRRFALNSRVVNWLDHPLTTRVGLHLGPRHRSTTSCTVRPQATPRYGAGAVCFGTVVRHYSAVRNLAGGEMQRTLRWLEGWEVMTVINMVEPLADRCEVHA